MLVGSSDGCSASYVQQNVSKCSMDLTPGFKNELQSKKVNLSKEKIRHELEGSCD